MEPLTVLFILLGSCFVCAVAGGSVAKEKNRDAVEGVLFGAIFGPFGILITALLPTKPASGQPQQADAGTIGQGKPRSLDDRGQIGMAVPEALTRFPQSILGLIPGLG